MLLKSMILYSEVNLLCIILLGIVLYKVLKGFDMQSTQRVFVWFLISLIIFVFLDLVWYLIDCGFVPGSFVANYWANALYFNFSAISCFLWFYYSESVQGSRYALSKRSLLISALPALVVIVMALTSYWTGWFFYIDGDNHYHRGSLYFVQVTIAYGYLLFTAGKAYWHSRTKARYADRARLRTLSSYVVPPAIFGAFQTLLPGVPLLCIGNTLAVLCVYFSFQEQLISVDPLTQLNNRNQLLRQLSNKMNQYAENHPAGRRLYLLMMDVDYFKQINDRFGHVEGDRALVHVADGLRRVCADTSHFLARYGGDEFILLCELPDDEAAAALCRDIRQTVEDVNREAQSPYELKVSVGFAPYAEGMGSIQTFIAAADVALYQIKRDR